VLLQATLRVPWCEIAKCVPLYALAVAHFTCNIGYYTLLTCLPLYFKYILHFDIKSVSQYICFDYLFYDIFHVKKLSSTILDCKHFARS